MSVCLSLQASALVCLCFKYTQLLLALGPWHLLCPLPGIPFPVPSQDAPTA